MAESYTELLREAILNEDSFVEAVFQVTRPGEAIPWTRITIRPVSLKDGRHLQFSHFDGTQDTARNFSGAEALVRLDELSALPLKSIQVTSTGETIRVQFSKKGRPIVHREQRKGQPIRLDLAHDRAKPGILRDDQPIPFLQAIGVMTSGGEVRANQRDRKSVV